MNLMCLSPPCKTSLPEGGGDTIYGFSVYPEIKSCAHCLAVLQVISFFTNDLTYLFEGVYYGPMIWIAFTTLTASTITTCILLGPTALLATLCYLLVLPLEVTSLK